MDLIPHIIIATFTILTILTLALQLAHIITLTDLAEQEQEALQQERSTEAAAHGGALMMDGMPLGHRERLRMIIVGLFGMDMPQEHLIRVEMVMGLRWVDLLILPHL